MAEAAAKGSFNMRNPAVKRILQEVKEMAKEDCKDYMSMPLEEDIFEWQFAIHGPKDSEFEGGIYHGRITLPADYPFKPPSFMLLTPSGRFETQTKICLSISNHHPEHWQPSWSVRTALVALIAFMPTKPNGALGSLEYTKRERRALAIKSRLAPPQFGSPDRQRIIQQIHEAMFRTAPPVPTTPLVEDEPSGPGNSPAAAPAPAATVAPAAAPAPVRAPPQASSVSGPLPGSWSSKEPGSSSAKEIGAAGGEKVRGVSATADSSHGGVAASASASASAAAEGVDLGSSSQGAHGQRQSVNARERAASVAPSVSSAPQNHAQHGVAGPSRRSATAAAAAAARPDSETVQEWVLSLAAVLLVLAIMFILGQKIARAYTGVAFTGGESDL